MMVPRKFMRREKGAVDVFAAFMNASSVDAVEGNFAVLRELVGQAEAKVMGEVEAGRLSGVSVGTHPFFQRRGSYDGRKMVVATRFTCSDETSCGEVAGMVAGMGFEETAMSHVAAARELVRVAGMLLGGREVSFSIRPRRYLGGKVVEFDVRGVVGGQILDGRASPDEVAKALRAILPGVSKEMLGG
jgi:hypothetical protein